MGQGLKVQRGGAGNANILMETVVQTWSINQSTLSQQFTTIPCPEGYGVAGIAEIRLIGDKDFKITSSYHTVTISWSNSNSFWRLTSSLTFEDFTNPLSVALEVDVIFAKQTGYKVTGSNRNGTTFTYALPYGVKHPANTPIKFA